MCGRYSLALRPSQVRRFLEDQDLPVNDSPPDEDSESDHTPRQTYNFAPGYYGMVYRADVPATGAGSRTHDQENAHGDDKLAARDAAGGEESTAEKAVAYKLQSMKWGLIPFWTKRSPDYGSMLKTINCRADSLAQPGGLWTTMKARKRCVVLCQGFYEWRTRGAHRTPFYIKRADGGLMCFAGLWDCVRYEDAERDLWTYTVVTTESNRQLGWLHDRMPVILDADGIRKWLDPGVCEWKAELQGLCKPFEGELEYYAVSQDVGKVGNNSKNFIVPVDSKENKNNIANFFAKGKESGKMVEVKSEKDEDRETLNVQRSEDNAPVPVPKEEVRGIKREYSGEEGHGDAKIRRLSDGTNIKSEHEESPQKWSSPSKQKASVVKRSKSATSNGTLSPSKTDPKAKGSQKITSFFGKG